MKIVVTGALGHIGSRLIRELPFSFPRCEILMIDNLMTQRYCSLFNLPKEGNYRFIEADITQMDLHPMLESADVAVHLAAITDATGSFDKAALVEKNNYKATRRIAEACAEAGVRLITLSSTSVYGTQAEIVDENCAPEELKPQSPYAVTKLKEEGLVQQLVKDHGLRANIFRFGTIFGVSPGIRFHTAINKFCWQAAMGIPITVWSTAYDQKRPYLDLGDAVRAVEFAIKKNLSKGLLYNVVTANATVRHIVDAIRLYIPKLEVEFVDTPIMNQFSYEVLNKKIANAGFQASGNLNKEIAKTVRLLKTANIVNDK
jgi:nucleoside-diphosphate-sugar epimerase